MTTRNEITRLERRLASFVPTQTYLVINTVDNRFSLYRNRQLVREGYCSSGSYTLLKTEEGDKEWIFKTPRGRLTIREKSHIRYGVSQTGPLLKRGCPSRPDCSGEV
jgi:L,D-transpeptidase YbiS